MHRCGLREARRRDECGTGVSATGNQENQLTWNASASVIYKYVRNFRRKGKTNTERDEQGTESLKECQIQAEIGRLKANGVTERTRTITGCIFKFLSMVYI